MKTKTVVKSACKALCSVLVKFYILLVLSSSAFAQSEEFRLLDNNPLWQLRESIPVQFDTYHPQGLTRVGDYFYLSSVEGREQPVAVTDQEFDRSTGAGIAHLFKFDLEGALIDQVQLGEGSLYHPGGIDFDGESIWIAVAEYRPDSQSIVYRVNPVSLQAEEVLRFDDHLGAIVFDPEGLKLHGVSWDSRDFYSWDYYTMEDGDSSIMISPVKTRHTSSRIAYQDCQFMGSSEMICSGIGNTTIDNTHTLTIGGIELLDLNSHSIEHRLSAFATTASGEFMVRNPSYLEFHESGANLFYFLPEDNTSNLYIYEVTPVLN